MTDINDHLLSFVTHLPVRAASKKHCGLLKTHFIRVVNARLSAKEEDAELETNTNRPISDQVSQAVYHHGIGRVLYDAVEDIEKDPVTLKMIFHVQTVWPWIANSICCYRDIHESEPLTLLQMAVRSRNVKAARMLWQAGAKFRTFGWQAERKDEDRRRAEENCRRAQEDRRRAEEDRRRAKEDRRRAKEDSRRSRQDARKPTWYRDYCRQKYGLNLPEDYPYHLDSWEEEHLEGSDMESWEEAHQEEDYFDDMQEALAEQEEEEGENDEENEDKTDDMLERAELQRATAESEKSHRESECQRENADLAEALMRQKGLHLGGTVMAEEKLSSAPGRLQHEHLSTCSSWRRAARAIPEIEATSQVTPEPWDDAAWQSAALKARVGDAEDARDPAGYVPQQPPGIFYPSMAAAGQGANTANSWEANTLVNVSMHLVNCIESLVGAVHAVDPAPSDHGNDHACAGQGTKETKRRNRLKYNKSRRQALEEAVLLEEMD